MLTIENDDRHSLFEQFYHLLWRGASLVMPCGEVHLNFFEFAFALDIFLNSNNTSQTPRVNTLYFAKNDVRTSIKNFTNRVLSLNKRRCSWHEKQPDETKP